MKPKLIAVCLLVCAGILPLFVTSAYGQLSKLWQNDYSYVYDSDNISEGYIIGDRLQFDGSGNCYFLSEFDPRATDYYEFHPQVQTIKYNAAGNTLWTRKDTSTGQNTCSRCGLSPYKMIVNSDGTSYSVASINDGSYAPYTLLAATQPGGTGKWRNTSLGYGPKDMVQDYTGSNIVVSTSETINGYGEQYIILTKVNPAGNTNWTKSHNSPDGFGWTQDQKTTVDKYGNIYVASSTYYYTANTENIQNNLYIMKFDTSGTRVWTKTLEKVSYLYQPRAESIVYNPADDCVYLSYFYYQTEQAGKLRKISAGGDTVWSKVIATDLAHEQSKLKCDKQGNIYYWSSDQYYGHLPAYVNDEEALLVKYNSAGIEVGRMSGNSFATDDNGYTYTSNYYQDGNTYQTYDAIRKYSPGCTLLYETPATLISNGRYTSEVFVNGTGNVYNYINIYNEGLTSVVKYNTSCSATSAPAKPKSITGTAALYCGNDSYIYSCPTVAKATYYNWTVPAGVVIESGQGTTKIYVHHYNGGFKKGMVNVYAANCYGASAVTSKVVIDTLKAPTKITGPTSVCKGQTYVSYSTTAVAGAQYYQWTIPAGAIFSSGYGGNGQTSTPDVRVDFGNAGGKVSVYAVSYCDSGIAKSVQVKVTNCVAGMSVEVSPEKSTVYPNPSAGAFTLRLGNGYHSSVSIIVKDVSGKVLERLSSATGSTIRFGDKLVKGVYFVEIENRGEREVLKVVKE